MGKDSKAKAGGNDDGIARLKLFKSDNFWCHGQRMWVICARPGMQITYTAQIAEGMRGGGRVGERESGSGARLGREGDRDGKARQSRADGSNNAGREYNGKSIS